MNGSTFVLEAAVDWLTCARHGRDGTDALQAVANALVAAEVVAGEDVAPFELHGYVGWRVGRVRYGERESAGLLQLSGQLAEDQAATLVPLADSVTRLDLALTVVPGWQEIPYGEEQYAAFCKYHGEHPRSALPWHTADAVGGFTGYLGQRTSDTFYRLYDKEQESINDADLIGSARYKGAWRHEIEYHDDAAGNVARATLAGDDRAQWISAHVAGYVQAHGGRADWPLDAAPTLVGGFRRRSDRDSRLRWMRRQVAPAIKRELERGNPGEVLKALGLSEKTP